MPICILRAASSARVPRRDFRVTSALCIAPGRRSASLHLARRFLRRRSRRALKATGSLRPLVDVVPLAFGASVSLMGGIICCALLPLALFGLARTYLFSICHLCWCRRRRGHALLSYRSHCHSCSERLLRRRRRLPRCRGSRRRRRSCRVEPLLRPWYLLVRMAARGRRAHRAALPPSGRGFLMRRRAGISFPVIGARIRGRHLLAAGR